MSEEELNQELSTDELKDVAGGMGELRSDHIGALKSNNFADEDKSKWGNRLSTKDKFDKGRGSFFSRGLHNNG